MTRAFNIKRVYEPASDEDGFRVLVDRLWPRGVRKENARIDLWAKDISPSDALRREFHGHPEHWQKFVAAYRKELVREPAASAARDLLARRKKGGSPCSMRHATRSITTRSRSKLGLKRGD
jgi:uncharacterized protein YeaO (DUF488 family)